MSVLHQPELEHDPRAYLRGRVQGREGQTLERADISEDIRSS